MAEKPLLPIYLFNGDDSLKQEKLFDRLKQRIEAMSEGFTNMQIVEYKDLQSPEHLLDILNTMPFGAPIRSVLLKEVDNYKKAFSDVLSEYVLSPLGSTVLAMTATKLARTSKLYKSIEAQSPQCIIDCGQKKRSELPQLIRGIAQGEGVDIGPAAANALIDRVGTSTVTLNTEIKKLAAIVKARTAAIISDTDVSENVVRLQEPKAWDLANALALRSTGLCLQLIGRMQGYTEIGLLAVCVSRIREILTAQTLQNRKEPIARGMGKQDWQIKEIVRGAGLYSQKELIGLLEEAPNIERKMKTGADAKILLEQWLIGACSKSPKTTLDRHGHKTLS